MAVPGPEKISALASFEVQGSAVAAFGSAVAFNSITLPVPASIEVRSPHLFETPKDLALQLANNKV
jgi:hypothetical protein